MSLKLDLIMIKHDAVKHEIKKHMEFLKDVLWRSNNNTNGTSEEDYKQVLVGLHMGLQKTYEICVGNDQSHEEQ